MINLGDLDYNHDERGFLLKRRGTGYIKTYPDKDGYLKYHLGQRNYKTFNIFVHQVIWKIFYGEIPHGLTVDHIDKDKQNNHPKNLQLLTAEENAIKGNARRWIAIDPSGNEHHVYNMEQFCRDNDLHPGHMRATSKSLKRHKGWYCHE